MSQYYINGIQQIGIGNNDVYATYEWYKANLGMDVPVFDEAAEAALMLPYTGGKPRSRHAILALNLQGGGGAEIWQYTSRKAQGPKTKVRVGDLGIFTAQFKCKSAEESHSILSKDNIVSPIFKNNCGQSHFYLQDRDGNWVDVVEYDSWFSQNKGHSGGICGAMIGVSNMDKSLAFYKEILGYNIVLSDSSENVQDLQYLASQDQDTPSSFRRVILTHKDDRNGAFSELFGRTQIELVQRLDFSPVNSFEDRLWGDLGYIHLCFDVDEMDALKTECAGKGHTFQVDSGDFAMGDAGGRFAYVEDPDGTLIEFVETHKVPVVKKIGWYFNLKNRKKRKPLARWMIKAMGW